MYSNLRVIFFNSIVLLSGKLQTDKEIWALDFFMWGTNIKNRGGVAPLILYNKTSVEVVKKIDWISPILRRLRDKKELLKLT